MLFISSVFTQFNGQVIYTPSANMNYVDIYCWYVQIEMSLKTGRDSI